MFLNAYATHKIQNRSLHLNTEHWDTVYVKQVWKSKLIKQRNDFTFVTLFMIHNIKKKKYMYKISKHMLSWSTLHPPLNDFCATTPKLAPFSFFFVGISFCSCAVLIFKCSGFLFPVNKIVECCQVAPCNFSCFVLIVIYKTC